MDPSYLPPSLFVIGILVMTGYVLLALLVGIGIGRSIRNRDRQVPHAVRPEQPTVDRA